MKHSQNTTNLFKHLKAQHPDVHKAIEEEKAVAEKLKKAKQTKQQSLEDTFVAKVPYPSESKRRKFLDESLVNMITTDLQPPFIVEDTGFQSFISALDPRYKPPSRRTIMHSLLPEKYRSEKEKLQETFSSVKYVALTTDIWTSRHTEGFLTVTCHYVTPDWQLCTAVLSTMNFSGAHTAEHIAETLGKIADDWSIRTKIVCIVTDNAANCVAAVRLLNWRHLPCFAHTLNLIVQEAIKADAVVADAQKKCKAVVSYFHHSVKASDTLREVQHQLKLPENKLINDVETRWNSTYYMMERILQQKQAITTVLCLLDRKDLLLDTQDFDALKEAIQVLNPFEAATRELSGEKHVSVSKVIPLSRNLQHLISGMSTVVLTKQMQDSLVTSLRRRFLSVETVHACAAATILDPRFKKLAFTTAQAIDQVSRRLQSEISELDSPQSSPDTEEAETPMQCGTGLWELFDVRVAQAMSSRTSSTEAIVETDQYFKEKNISRSADAIEWWKNKAVQYRKMAVLAKKYLAIPATSVPSERVFSKAGELVSAKRSRLKPKNVDMMLFLNKN